MGFAIGIGGTVAYPNNQQLRDIVKTVTLKDIVLETDAPFLPPQKIRGKQNSPKYIQTIAHFIAVRYLDKNEQTVPLVGLVQVEDIETGRCQNGTYQTSYISCN